MRLRMAEHRPPRRGKVGECERVGCCSSGHQENGGLTREKLGEPLLDAPRPGVAAVGQRGTLIRPRDGGKNLRRDPSRVVAREVHKFARRLHRPRKRAVWCLGSRSSSCWAARRAQSSKLLGDRELVRPKSVAVFGTRPGNFRTQSDFLDRRTLAFMIRIWQGQVGQYCCPSWGRCFRAVLSHGRHRTVRSGPSRMRGAA